MPHARRHGASYRLVGPLSAYANVLRGIRKDESEPLQVVDGLCLYNPSRYI
ncbi:MAG TPA: hypothetical protein VG818_02530 [Gemmatimonadaceae bacterium]|nr:hypothetical protein [Gemmatimonadaceae bacterium]